MNVFLIDGTYELFRHFYAIPSTISTDGDEIGAVRGVLGSVLSMLEEGVTHLGVATDNVVESFRNELWDEYKTSDGIDPLLSQQFHPLEDALTSLGVKVWPMIEFEADDALASAAMRAEMDDRVEQVFICSPDKDLAQCVRGQRVVQFDRRAGVIRDAVGVRKRFGVKPESITDYLGLVGDAADGYPGLPGWGAKSASALLSKYDHIEKIPDDMNVWDVKVRGGAKLASTLNAQRGQAIFFRKLATLKTNISLFESVNELKWIGPPEKFLDVCVRLNAPGYFKRAKNINNNLK